MAWLFVIDPSATSISRCKKQSEWQFCECHVDGSRMDRLIQADKKATVT